MTTAFLLEELLRFAYALNLKAGATLAVAIALPAGAIAVLAVVAGALRKRASRRSRTAAPFSLRARPQAAEMARSSTVPPLASAWRASG
jgi:hypothetical protein